MLAKACNHDHAVLDLRLEVHDGRYVRRAGSGGGRTFAWQGKAGALGAVTEEIDRHHNIVAAMGPRFLYWRMPPPAAPPRPPQTPPAPPPPPHASAPRRPPTRT